MPPGTDVIQCETAPSGRIITPCCEYDAPTSPEPQQSLTLRAKEHDRTEITGDARREGDSQVRRNGNRYVTWAANLASEVPRPPSAEPRPIAQSGRPVPPPPQHEPMV